MLDMHNIDEFLESSAKKIEVVFADIDDTISSNGKILPEAYSAMWSLFRSGIHLVPITGRSAGWVDHIARMWPVKGVVGENGAFYAYMDDSENPSVLKKRNYVNPEQIKEFQNKFEDIKKEVFTLYPTTKLASDQNYRDFDLAIDFCEDVPPLPMEDVESIVKIFQKHGAQTKISSIHVNGWFGDYDKITMTKIFSREILDIELEDNPEKAIFIGDSPNDQLMFEFFPNSVGVQNVRKYQDFMSFMPVYITEKQGGLGFAEMVDHLLKKR